MQLGRINFTLSPIGFFWKYFGVQPQRSWRVRRVAGGKKCHIRRLTPSCTFQLPVPCVVFAGSSNVFPTLQEIRHDSQRVLASAIQVHCPDVVRQPLRSVVAGTVQAQAAIEVAASRQSTNEDLEAQTSLECDCPENLAGVQQGGTYAREQDVDVTIRLSTRDTF